MNTENIVIDPTANVVHQLTECIRKHGGTSPAQSITDLVSLLTDGYPLPAEISPPLPSLSRASQNGGGGNKELWKAY